MIFLMKHACYEILDMYVLCVSEVYPTHFTCYSLKDKIKVCLTRLRGVSVSDKNTARSLKCMLFLARLKALMTREYKNTGSQ